MDTAARHRPEIPDHARFAALVEPHLPALRAFVDRRDPTLGDEVMSELTLVAWRRLDDLPAGHERAWLFGVARTVLMAERRKAATRHATEFGGPALEGLSSVDLSPEVAPTLMQALGRLSQRDRELLLLTAWEGLSTGEVASVLEIRATAARMGLVRARRRLAAALDDLDPDWRHEHLGVAAASRSSAEQPRPAAPPATSDPTHALARPTPAHAHQEAPSCADAEH